MRGEVVSLETGVGSADAPDLRVVVSFHNESAASCRITGYALAWGGGPQAARHACTDPVSVAPGATAHGTCLVPDTSPLREAAGRTEANLTVVDVSSACDSSTP
jgi:hypothetical protein